MKIGGSMHKFGLFVCGLLFGLLPSSVIQAEICQPGDIVEVAYTLENVTIPGVTRPVRLRAVGHAPAFATASTPLVLIANLNHSRCRNAAGATVRTIDYDCPAGYTEVPLAEGMSYLTEHLADRGMVAVSIDSNQMMWWFERDFYEVVAERASLMQAHLRLWETDPPVPADTNNVFVVGHSLGGEVSLELTAREPGVKQIYMIAPASESTSITDTPVGVLLGACDEDPGTHNFPGMRLFDALIDVRQTRIQQAYLPGANHRHFNSNADAGGTGCNIPPMDAELQRLNTADIVASWLLNEPITTTARLSTFGVNPTKVVPTFTGFTSVQACTANGCEPFSVENPNPYYYYLHNRPSYALTWNGPASIRVPLVPGQFFSFRVTQSIDSPLNTPNFLKKLSVYMYNQTGSYYIKSYYAPWPVTTYDLPCAPNANGTLVCSSWWMLNREFLHSFTVAMLPDRAYADIKVTGTGRIIIADFEVSN